MSDRTGTPIWYELLTDDADSAQSFYTDVVGWSASDSGMPGIDYRLLSAPDGGAVAGLMQRAPDMGGAPTWLIYFATDDVDATSALAEGHGGVVHLPPTTMPGVGRMAMIADPHGAAFYLMRGESDAPGTSFRPSDAASLGHAVWNELTAPDQDAALAFYGAILGLRHEGAMPMGPLGDYKFVHVGATSIGATMNTPPGGRDGWMPYFLVPDIDAGVASLAARGGTVVQGPDKIPGGSFSVVAEDPQGVRFGLVGDRTGETR